jgi:glutathione peroxidase
MKALLFIVMSMTITSVSFAQTNSFYDFTTKDIDGKELKMSDFKGKKVLVVNVASKCGNTPQYETLEQLYQKYGTDKFVIVGFPANNFRAQEPGTNAEIKEFCSSKYHVTFPMMSKISVKGDDMDPIYKWLTTKSENGVMDAPVTWNFQKFMIDEKGKLVGMVEPQVDPDCDKIIKWLEQK